MALRKFRVDLNGTDENPYNRLGLTCNPFPQLGRQEYDAAERIVRQLGGDPIPDVDYIRRHLKGFSDEFVKLCCSQFKKGKFVSFDVCFEDDE